MHIFNIQKCFHYPLSMSLSLVRLSATLSALVKAISLSTRSPCGTSSGSDVDNPILVQINKRQRAVCNENVMLYIFCKKLFGERTSIPDWREGPIT